MNLRFFPVNLELIYDLKKTSTLRSQREFETIGLKVGQKDKLSIKDKIFSVECVGLVHVDEIGGKEAVWKTEGFDFTPPKFEQTKKILEGKIKLYYYRISLL